MRITRIFVIFFVFLCGRFLLHVHSKENKLQRRVWHMELVFSNTKGPPTFQHHVLGYRAPADWDDRQIGGAPLLRGTLKISVSIEGAEYQAAAYAAGALYPASLDEGLRRRG
jgi:hypothetical protein